MSTMTHLPQRHAHRLRLNPWFLVVGLAAALVGLGAWVIVDQTTSSPGGSATTATPELASPATVTMLNDRLVALNRADAKAEAAFFTRDAMMNDVMSGSPTAPQPLVIGNQEIGRYLAGLVNTYGMQLQSMPPIIHYGRTVIETMKAPGDKEPMLMLVYRLAPNGKIASEWVLPAGSEVTDFG